MLPAPLGQDLRSVEAFEAAASTVRPEDLSAQVRIGCDLAQHAAWLRADLDQGFERIYLHNVNRQQQRFIEAFASSVLPQLR